MIIAQRQTDCSTIYSSIINKLLPKKNAHSDQNVPKHATTLLVVNKKFEKFLHEFSKTYPDFNPETQEITPEGSIRSKPIRINRKEEDEDLCF